MNKDLLVKHSAVFTVNPDSAPLFPGAGHQAALDNLVSGLRLGRRLQYLTGAPGCGKSTLLLHFRRTAKNLNAVYIGQSYIGDHVSRILSELGLSEPANLELAGEDLFNELRAQMVSQNNPILLVDNVEGLGVEELKQLDLLSSKLSLPVIFAGNCDFARLADTFDSDKAPVSDRVYRIDALKCQETADYVRSRLEYSGVDEPLFSENALQQVYLYSEGNPRLVNLICNNALILIGLNDQSRVTPDVVDEVVRNRQSGGAFPFAASPQDTSRDAGCERESHGSADERPDGGRGWPVYTGSRGGDATGSSQAGDPSAMQSQVGDGAEPNDPVGAIRPEARATPARQQRSKWAVLGLAAGLGTLVMTLSSLDEQRAAAFLEGSSQIVRQFYTTGREAATAAVLSARDRLRNIAGGSQEPGVSEPDLAATPVPIKPVSEPAPPSVAESVHGAGVQAPNETEKRIQDEIRELQTLKTEIASLSEALSGHLKRHAEAHRHADEGARVIPVQADAASPTYQSRPTETAPAITEAQQDRLVDIYLERARYERERDQIHQALVTVDQGLAIDPHNPALLNLKRSLTLH